MLNVAKYGALGLVGGSIAGAAVVKPKTQKGEHALNKFSTAVGLGALATTPYLAKNLVKNNPESTLKIAHKTGAAIEKGTEYAVKYGKKVIEYAEKGYEHILRNEKGKGAINWTKHMFSKAKNSVIGKKIVNAVSKVVKQVASNKNVQKVATKAAEALKTFAKSSTTKKGAIGLVAAGVALLAYAGFKTITNYYKKEGAIDQKYQDIKVMNELLS